MGEPLYRKIAESLKSEIAEDVDLLRLETERQLAQRFHVGVSTIKHALTDLVEQGLIERSPGRGTFVCGRNAVDSSGRPQELSFNRVVGVVIPSIRDHFVSNLLRGVLQGLYHAGWQTLVDFSEDNQDKESHAIRRMREQRVDGMIIFPVEGEAYNDEILRLKVENFPFVLLDRELPGIEAPCVSSDHFAAVNQAVRHLIELGHTRIAFVSMASLFPMTTQSIVLRIGGFREAMKGLVGSVDELVLTRAAFQDAKADLKDYLADRIRKLRVTAALCDSIDDTCQVMDALPDLVPKELCLIGFDYGLKQDAKPGVLWVDQHEFDIGVQAARSVLETLLASKPVPSVKIPADIRAVGSREPVVMPS